MIQKIKSFEYVIAVAEKCSISEAADKLNIAQPALSRHIADIEKKIGTELFDRKTLPITLTEAGRRFVEAGRRILDADRQLEKQIEDIKTRRGHEVRVGAGPTRGQMLFPKILKEFVRSYPAVRVVTDERQTAQLCEMLRDGTIDLMITFEDLNTELFAVEDLYEETIGLAVPERYVPKVEAVLKNGEVDVRRPDVPFVSLHNGQRLRNALDILSRHTVTPRYDCDYLESAMSLVREGLGVTLAPFPDRTEESGEALRCYPVAIPQDLSPEEMRELKSIIHRRIGIFYRKEQFLSEAEKGYIAAAKIACASL